MGKRKILIADNEEYLHLMYDRFLSDNYDVVHAYNGVETLMLAVDEHPNIILMDPKMPVINGHTVCRKIKQTPEIQDIKIIIMSGSEPGRHTQLADLGIGADDYIRKPCSCDYLKLKLKNVFHQLQENG